jgi:ethanolamine permease
LAGGVVGIVSIYIDEWISIGGQTLTATIITMSVFGALTSYILSLLSLFQLRKSEPNRVRSYKAPFYPILPLIALGLAIICITTMIFLNIYVFLLFLGLVLLGYVYFLLTHLQRKNAGFDHLLDGE